MSQASPEDASHLMSDSTFSSFQKLTLQYTGIELADKKRSMVATRLGRRLNALNLGSLDEYLQIISDAGHPETAEFIDTITTNLTYFFREPHHFEILREQVFPAISAGRSATNPIRIWSAGCSSGQEPYSIGITAMEALKADIPCVRILSTDIHTKLVMHSQRGIYDKSSLRGLDDAQREKWFKRLGANSWQADSRLRNLLMCRQLNLFGPLPIRPGVDVIMCRNVLIYFNLAYQRKLLTAFAKLQHKGSYLFLGHSETLEGFSKEYQRVGNTVYQRL